MARRDALVRLFNTLLVRREDHRKKMARALRNLRDYRAADSTATTSMAFEADSDELASRLVERDDNELSQIERAVMRWKRQTVRCEIIHCDSRYPRRVRRLGLAFAGFRLYNESGGGRNWKLFHPQK